MVKNNIALKKNEYIYNLSKKILNDCKALDIELRFFGSVALFYLDDTKISWLSENRKAIADIDIVVPTKCIDSFEKYLLNNNFKFNGNIKMLYGNIRRNYYSTENISIDVFIENIFLCQEVIVNNRLNLSYPTIPVADLFLSKIQKHNLSVTDVFDIDYILNYLVDKEYIINLCANQWNWWKTLQTNIPFLINSNFKINNVDKLKDLWISINHTNKSFSWKLRSIVGQNLPWYNYVEE